MVRKGTVFLSALLLLLPVVIGVPLPVYSSASNGSSADSVMTEGWNGQNVIDLTEALCNISARHPAFRVSGSEGANEAADFIMDQFLGYGLQVHEEEFELPVWDLSSETSMRYDIDGNWSTGNDSIMVCSFNAEAYSLPTPEGGLYGSMVTLPLPQASSSNDIGRSLIDDDAWDEINTTGRVLLIGREVRWDTNWEQSFKEKLEAEPPAVIILHYSYEWMKDTELYSQPSTGGRPLGSLGPYYWDLDISVGSINYSDGLILKNALLDAPGGKVMVNIPSVISEGTHRNIIADIPSSSVSNEILLIGAHYDTVLCEGYIDNTASVATLLETARMVQAARDSGELEMRFGIRFVAFAGEELGLVGSLNYVSVHRDELSDHVAIMVADCIGSHIFKVTDPLSSGDAELIDATRDAARKLEVPLLIEGLDASDHISFQAPTYVANSVNTYWNTDWDLNGVQISPNSMLFYSSPLSIFDEPSGPYRGYIHTNVDSIDGAQHEWVNENDLKGQASVVALTALYIIADDDQGQDWTWLFITLLALAVAGGYLVYRYIGRHH
jgi:hypothetical protein